jgi:hypothetical protein
LGCLQRRGGGGGGAYSVGGGPNAPLLALLLALLLAPLLGVACGVERRREVAWDRGGGVALLYGTHEVRAAGGCRVRRHVRGVLPAVLQDGRDGQDDEV